jgi:hypothetical protein
MLWKTDFNSEVWAYQYTGRNLILTDHNDNVILLEKGYGDNEDKIILHKYNPSGNKLKTASLEIENAGDGAYIRPNGMGINSHGLTAVCGELFNAGLEGEKKIGSYRNNNAFLTTSFTKLLNE